MQKENKSDDTRLGGTAVTEDLSKAIEGSIEKQPGEEVRSVRVHGDHYRCNWWVRDELPGPLYLNVGRITRSKFLRATKTGKGLVIEDLSSPS